MLEALNISATPLAVEHEHLKAKLTLFAGFRLPVSFSSIKEEYHAVREATGVFDISHMAPILFISKKPGDVVNFLNYLTCRDLSGLKEGQVQYNALINERGGVIDDITIFRIKQGCFMIIANAVNRKAAVEHVKSFQERLGSSCQIMPVENYVLLALQGPKAEMVLAKMEEFIDPLEDLFYYECASLKKSQGDFCSLISRTGYTGEDGFEILLPKQEGIFLWKKLLKHGASPCGLAVRDILRMEMFYPLYGNELSSEKTPLESGLGWLVDDKKDFLGKREIMAVRKTLHGQTLGFQLLEDGVPRENHEVILEDKTVGHVTSGSFSFQWNKGFGIAYINPDVNVSILERVEKEQFYVDVRGSRKKMKFFQKSPHKKAIKRRPK